MVATADDYAWFEECFPDLAEAYCLTLVRGLSPPQVLARLGARTNGPSLTGIELLGHLDLAGHSDLGYDNDLDDNGEQLIAVTEVDGGWALAIEDNGFLGVTEDAVVPLSAGTRLVSHFRNVNAVDRFCWVDDGEVRTTFEPGSPSYRHGTAPDELLEPMRAAGFNLNGNNYDDATPTAFALAEHLTGVRVTAELLRESHFQCGLAPIP